MSEKQPCCKLFIIAILLTFSTSLSSQTLYNIVNLIPPVAEIPATGGYVEVEYFAPYQINPGELISFLQYNSGNWGGDLFFEVIYPDPVLGLFFASSGPNPSTVNARSYWLNFGQVQLLVVQPPNAPPPPPPTIFSVSGGGEVLAGNGVDINLSGSESDVTYQLKRSGSIVNSKNGTGSPISFTNITTAGSYTITGVRGSSSSNMSGTATVVVNGDNEYVVGKISAKFEVSPTGAATYTIPIECPAGINGLQPEISLVYNSQSGNGIAGWGWNFSGLSMITRVPQNNIHDGKKSGIIWNSSSPYAIDGNRLFIKNQTYGTDSIEYYPEKDIGAHIVGVNIKANGPEYFKVYYKNGKTAIYGQNLDSRFPLRYLSYSNEHNLGWALVKLTDPNGNYLEIVYDNDENHQSPYIYYSSHRIQKIKYGANSNASSSHFGEIEFVYESRSDTEEKYIGGFESKQEKRLKQIKAKSNSTVVNQYDLTYVFNESSKLSSIAQTSNGYKKKPLKFNWSNHDYSFKYPVDGTYTFTPSSTFQSYINANGSGQDDDIDKHRYIHTGDFNNDGLTDFILEDKLDDINKYQWAFYLNDGDLNPEFKIENDIDKDLFGKSIMIFDKDGDGIDELYEREYVYSGGHKCALRCWEWDPPNNTLARNSSKDYYIPLVSSGHYKTISIIPGDFNDNGIIDLIVLRDMKYYNNVGLGSISGFPYFKTEAGGSGHDIRRLELLDFNGDKKIDVMVVEKNEVHINTFNTTTNSFECLYINTDLDHEFNIKIGDFNGDGNSDVFAEKDNGMFSGYSIHMSDGTAFIKDVIQPPYTLSLFKKNLSFMMVADVNGDDKSDIIWPVEENDRYRQYIYVSNGSSFSNVGFSNNADYNYRPYYHSRQNYTGTEQTEVLVGEFRNDDSHIGVIPSTVKYMEFGVDADYNYITNIINSHNDTLVIDYDYIGIDNLSQINQISLGSSTHFSSDRNTTLKAVSNVKTNIEEKQYAYNNAIVHKQGRGFLGFDFSIVIDKTKEMATFSEYELNNTYELLQMKRSVVMTTNTALNNLKSVTLDFDVNIPELYMTETFYSNSYTKYPTPASKGFQHYYNKITTKNHLKEIGKTVEYTYDNYLNLLTETEKFYSDHTESNLVLTKQTSFSNYNSSGSWCLSKPGTKTYTWTRGSDTESRSLNYTYDNKGNLLTETKDPGDVNALLTEYKLYDDFGQPQRVEISANGVTRATTFEYTTSGRYLHKKTDLSFGETTTYTYNENYGLLLSEKDQYNLTTTYEYGAFGRLKKTTYPDGNTAQKFHKWADQGAPAGSKYFVENLASGKAPVITWYDKYNRELRIESYGLDASTKIFIDTEYNAKGQVYRKSEPYFEGGSITWAVTYEYDKYGRTVRKITPLGTITIDPEDDNGSPLTTVVVSPSGTSKKTTNAAGETTINEINGKTVSFTYYPSGKTKTATPQNGVALSMEYDLQGNRTKLIDPDAGTITSAFNGFGDVVWEKQRVHTGTAQDTVTTTYNYLTSGLINTITRNSEVTTHTYDSRKRLSTVAISGKHSMTYTYDGYNRITGITENIDGTNYASTKEYDSFGNITKETYPSGFYITNTYNSYGYLTEVKDDGNNSIWKAEEANARGQLTKTRFGNNQLKTFGYNSKSQPTSIVAGSAINQTYNFNSEGNLEYRQDNHNTQNIQKESFQYDTKNRLQSWIIYKNGSPQKTVNMGYDTKGNITTKSDLGYNMKYEHPDKPHALTAVSGTPASIPEHSQTITYTDFRKIESILDSVYIGSTLTKKKYEVLYGIDDQRRKTEYSEDGSIIKKHFYLGNYEITEDGSSNQRKIHYISGGDGIAAIYVENNSNDTTYFVHTDYLGSLTSLSDASGNVYERYAFDAWGQRRNPTDWKSADTRTNLKFNRGFTGHEHIDGFGLINMNGRVYDPVTACFLSPDPYVQAPGQWLNYNRYSYGLNNPMLYTDPSGEIFGLGPLLSAAVWGAIINSTVYTVQVALSDGGFSNWSVGGFLKSAGIGALQGMATHHIRVKFGDVGKIGHEIGRAAAHGAAQFWISGVTGGDPLASFLSGSLSSLVGSGYQKMGFEGATGMYVFAGFSGGVGAELAGGDFLKGAAIGIMNAGLNHLKHQSEKPDWKKLTPKQRAIIILNAGRNSDSKIIDLKKIFKNFDPSYGDGIGSGAKLPRQPFGIKIGDRKFKIHMTLSFKTHHRKIYTTYEVNVAIGDYSPYTHPIYGKGYMCNAKTFQRFKLTIYTTLDGKDWFDSWYYKD